MPVTIGRLSTRCDWPLSRSANCVLSSRMYGPVARLRILYALGLAVLGGCSVVPAPPPTSVPPTLAAMPTIAPTATRVPATPSPAAAPAAVTLTRVAPPRGLDPAPALQTVVPAAEATLAALLPTVQASVPTIAAVVTSEEIQRALQPLGALLGGSQLQVETVPAGVLPTDASTVRISGQDSTGQLRQVDRTILFLATQSALIALSQVAPQATLELALQSSGQPVVTGTRTPGNAPSVTVY